MHTKRKHTHVTLKAQAQAHIHQNVPISGKRLSLMGATIRLAYSAALGLKQYWKTEKEGRIKQEAEELEDVYDENNVTI